MSRLTESPSLPLNSMQPRCCSLGSSWTVGAVFVAFLAIGASAYLWGRSHGSQGQLSPSQFSQDPSNSLASSFPLIQATASVVGERYSMATGDVSDDAEGLFVLDHNSGLLQCSVVYPRSGQFMARFSVNVAEALGSGAKGGQYMMVTGRAQFPRASNRPAASTLVYVMDSATGNYACYGIPFDHTAPTRNQQQQGVLVLVATGSANPVVDRDNLR